MKWLLVQHTLTIYLYVCVCVCVCMCVCVCVFVYELSSALRHSGKKMGKFAQLPCNWYSRFHLCNISDNSTDFQRAPGVCLSVCQSVSKYGCPSVRLCGHSVFISIFTYVVLSLIRFLSRRDYLCWEETHKSRFNSRQVRVREWLVCSCACELWPRDFGKSDVICPTPCQMKPDISGSPGGHR